MDTGFNQFLMAPYMMAFEFDSPDGAMKTIEIAGQTGKMILEKEKGKITDTQVMFLVGGRLLVAAEGDEDAELDDIEFLFKGFDFKKLAGLAKKAKSVE